MTSNGQREFEKEIRSLDDHQLLRLVAVEASGPEALRIASDELHRRRVDVLSREQYLEQFSAEQVSTSSITDVAPVLPNTRKAFFGWLSLRLFAGGSLFVFAAIFLGILGVNTEYGISGEHVLGLIYYGSLFFCFTCIPTVLLALIGMQRRETPIWPAIASFALSLIPAAFAVWFLL
jgi:hypothetical protein